MNKRILIKPYITEKSTKMSETLNKYAFVVDRHANKLEIMQSVKAMYNVEVDNVHTIVVPAKRKTLFRNGKMTNGRKAGFKKAIVTLPAGEIINFFGSEGDNQ